MKETTDRPAGDGPSATRTGAGGGRPLRRWLRAHAVGPASRVLSRLGWLVSREDVLWCYRNLLGREPESEAAVQSHLHFRSFRALVRHVVASPEYRGRGGNVSLGVARRAAAQPPRVEAAAFRAAIDGYLAARPPSRETQVYVDTHFVRLLHTINVVTDLLPRGGRMVDYSAARFFSSALDTLHPGIRQTSVTGVNFERDDYAARLGHEAFDLCLNTEVIEHLLFDPAHMVFSINRMLATGGLLFLTTPNALSMANAVRLLEGLAPTLWNQVKPDEPYYERHNREWTPFEVAKLLEEHGFEVVELYTEDFYGTTRPLLAKHAEQCAYLRAQSSHAHFGDTLCVVARKRVRAERKVQNPWLYAFHERPSGGPAPSAAKANPPATKAAR